MLSMQLESVLLLRMNEAHRDLILRSRGLTHEQVDQIAQKSIFRYPRVLTASLDEFRSVLGYVSVRREKASDGEFTAHEFRLTLWPSMLWAVTVDSHNQLRSIGFRRPPLDDKCFSPSEAMRDFWTIEDVRKASVSMELFDGWDEHQVFRVWIDESVYEAEFVFSMLQSWNLVHQAEVQTEGG